ncbi:MAG: hypothetical protein AAF533_12790 [Acidobacteriota bacterium]
MTTTLRPLLVLLVLAAIPTRAAEPTLDGPLRRVTVPLAEVEDTVTVAASFLFREHAVDPSGPEGLLSASQVRSLLATQADVKRWQHPEHAIVEDLRCRREGDLPGLLACVEPGMSRERERELAKNPRLIQEEIARFDELRFLYEVWCGPYVGVATFLREAPTEEAPLGRGLPVFRVLQRSGVGYQLSHDLPGTHLVRQVVRHAADRLVVARDAQPLTIPPADLRWAAFDLGDERDGSLHHVVSGRAQPGAVKVPDGFSDGHLVLSYGLVDQDVTLVAGEQRASLSPALRFLESAVTAHALGSKDEIVACWSKRSRTSVASNIDLLAADGLWPAQRRSPFGKSTRVLGLLPLTSTETLVYHQPVNRELRTVVLVGDGQEQPFALSNRAGNGSLLSILRNPSFLKALTEQRERP